MTKVPPLPLATDARELAPYAINVLGAWGSETVEFCYSLTTVPLSGEQVATAIYSKLAGKELSRRRKDWQLYTRQHDGRTIYVFNCELDGKVEFELVRTLDAPRQDWDKPTPSIEPVAETPKAETVAVTVDVPLSVISNAFIGAFEGGSNYWLQGAYLKRGKALDSNWYADASLFGRDFQVAFHFDDPNKPEGNGKGRKTIERGDIVKGLQIMAAKEPRHFSDMLSENDDATTHDIFVQCLVLGEVVYG